MIAFFVFMYLEFGKWIYISLYNPFKTIKKLKGVFKPIKRKFRCGKQWYPVLWCSKPAYIQIMSRNVGLGKIVKQKN